MKIITYIGHEFEVFELDKYDGSSFLEKETEI